MLESAKKLGEKVKTNTEQFLKNSSEKTDLQDEKTDLQDLEKVVAGLSPKGGSPKSKQPVNRQKLVEALELATMIK